MTQKPKDTPFRGRKSFIFALAALAARGVSQDDDKYKATLKRSYRHGKHNGQVRGAFGRVRAKAHRALYVA